MSEQVDDCREIAHLIRNLRIDPIADKFYLELHHFIESREYALHGES